MYIFHVKILRFVIVKLTIWIRIETNADPQHFFNVKNMYTGTEWINNIMDSIKRVYR